MFFFNLFILFLPSSRVLSRNTSPAHFGSIKPFTSIPTGRFRTYLVSKNEVNASVLKKIHSLFGAYISHSCKKVTLFAGAELIHEKYINNLFKIQWTFILTTSTKLNMLRTLQYTAIDFRIFTFIIQNMIFLLHIAFNHI